MGMIFERLVSSILLGLEYFSPNCRAMEPQEWSHQQANCISKTADRSLYPLHWLTANPPIDSVYILATICVHGMVGISCFHPYRVFLPSAQLGTGSSSTLETGNNIE